jgi:hypothetical protein
MRALAAIFLLAAPVLAQTVEMLPVQAERAAFLADKRLSESSGLALSLRHPGILWTFNDSAGEPCVFAIDREGKTRAKVRLPDAVNFDWEDIASARNAEGVPCLYIADIGDNLHVRASVAIYEIPEPDLPQDAGKETRSAKPRFWHLRYPEGRPDAETLLVHPVTRRLYIVTKDPEGHSVLYACPEQPSSPGQTLLLKKLTSLEFPARERTGRRPHHACMATAGDISPDATRLVIATYSYLHEWSLPPGLSLAEALKKPARLIAPPVTPQMEGVCYDADSATLWFTSERLPAPLYRIRR